jgi:hypothetical protein
LSCNLTIVGIGDASTQSLSSLATTLGENCSFYGITQVNHADQIFGSIQFNAPSSNKLMLNLVNASGVVDLPLSFTVEDSDCTSGCVVISDPILLERVHCSTTVRVTFKKQATQEIPESPLSSLPKAVFPLVSEIVTLLKSVHSTPYDVTTDTFSMVFRRLQSDKRIISDARSLLFSKRTRKYRHYTPFAAISVWIQELDNLITTQVTSYRMNVEEEILNRLSSSLTGEGGASSEGGGSAFQPSTVVLERLQNNVC